MTPAETIAAAITVLEADLHDAEWSYGHEDRTISAVGTIVADNVMPPDGERITRWRRTLNAQLVILRRARRVMDPPTSEELALVRAALELSAAILGEAKS